MRSSASRGSRSKSMKVEANDKRRRRVLTTVSKKIFFTGGEEDVVPFRSGRRDAREHHLVTDLPER